MFRGGSVWGAHAGDEDADVPRWWTRSQTWVKSSALSRFLFGLPDLVERSTSTPLPTPTKTTWSTIARTRAGGAVEQEASLRVHIEVRRLGGEDAQKAAPLCRGLGGPQEELGVHRPLMRGPDHEAGLGRLERRRCLREGSGAAGRESRRDPFRRCGGGKFRRTSATRHVDLRLLEPHRRHVSVPTTHHFSPPARRTLTGVW